MRLLQKHFRFANVIATVVVFIAIYGGIKPACWGLMHQPKAPKCLIKD